MLVIQLPEKQLFPMGMITATPGALSALGIDEAEQSKNASTLLRRHASGDWGDICKEDANANRDALAEGTRLFSSYRLEAGEVIWIITEADRSVTTFLTPDEY